MDGLRIAIIGSRGIPAHYGGFESFAEELAPRLVTRGHEVTVYCRRGYTGADEPTEYRGVTLRYTPYLRRRSLETFTHEMTSIADSFRRRFDVYYFLGTRSSPLYVVTRATGRTIVVHTDGLEWKRRKWRSSARAYLRLAESVAARFGADGLVTDAEAMRSYYRNRYGKDSEYISYGAESATAPNANSLSAHGLKPGGYYLAVGRLEPENNIDLIIREYRWAGVSRKLVVVGGAPYETDYVRALRSIAAESDRVSLLGAIYDPGELDGLYANSYALIHGHEVGGSNPSLIRAMGAGACVLALDTPFNREVLRGTGSLWSRENRSLASLVAGIDGTPEKAEKTGKEARLRAVKAYSWDVAADKHVELFGRLVDGKGKK